MKWRHMQPRTPMPDSRQDLWALAVALCTKLWPGIVGALIAMRFQPEGASVWDRAFTGLASVFLAGIFGPAFVELFNIDTPYLQAAVGALVAIFGLIIIGEAVKAIREVGFAMFLRDWLRRIFGVGGGGGGEPR